MTHRWRSWRVLAVSSLTLLVFLFLLSGTILLLAYTDGGGVVAEMVPADADFVFFTPQASRLTINVLSSPQFSNLRTSSIWLRLLEETPSLQSLTHFLSEKDTLSSWQHRLLDFFFRAPLCLTLNQEGILAALQLKPLPKAFYRVVRATQRVTGFPSLGNEEEGPFFVRKGDILVLTTREDILSTIPKRSSSVWKDRMLENHDFLWVGSRALHGISFLRPIESLDCRVHDSSFTVHASLKDAYRKRAKRILSGHTNSITSLEGNALRVRWSQISIPLIVAFLDKSIHENLPLRTWFTWLFGEKEWNELLSSFQGNGEIQLALSYSNEMPKTEAAIFLETVKDHRLKEMTDETLFRLQEISPFPFVTEKQDASTSIHPLVSLPFETASIHYKEEELHILFGERQFSLPGLRVQEEKGPCLSLAFEPSVAPDVLKLLPTVQDHHKSIAVLLASLSPCAVDLFLREDHLLLRFNRL